MKRFGRWVFDALAAGSLGLCLAMGVVWAGHFSPSSNPTININLPFRWELELMIEYGTAKLGLDISHTPENPVPMLPASQQFHGIMRLGGSPRIFFHGYGFGLGQMPVMGPGASHYLVMLYWVEVPDWFVIAVLAILPAVAILRWLLRRRSESMGEGVCQVCGYDLRATPGRCPECGTIPSQK